MGGKVKRMKYEELLKANQTIKTTDIKGKQYAEVNQRIKAFRMICPNGGIITELLFNENGVCAFKATILDEEKNILGTGTAYEKESSSFINKTSYIENCETSAVGRALGMCGIGIDTSVASYEEVQNAINNQGKETIFCQKCKKVITDPQQVGESKAKTLEAGYDTPYILCPTCLDKALKKAAEK